MRDDPLSSPLLCQLSIICQFASSNLSFKILPKQSEKCTLKYKNTENGREEKMVGERGECWASPTFSPGTATESC